MCKKLFFLTSLVLVLGLAAPVSAATLLASYEPAEVNNLTVTTDPNKDPNLTVTWPVSGGINDVPPATEGNYVLKMDWTGETDPNNKVEIRHDWNDFTFDLAGEDYILADIYFATESVLPQIIGIWDDVFGWVSASCVPCTTNEWYTISFYVGNLEHTSLDHIFAFLFEQLSGDDGVIYVDNLRLGSPPDISQRKLSFAGYDWRIKTSGCGRLDPGSNYFSDSRENIWFDENGDLHLKIVNKCEKWYTSEIICDTSLGYGTYVFTVKGRVDLLDPNIVLGLFTWDTNAPQYNYREMDVEFSRWWDQNEPNNAQYVVQDWNTPGNRHRFSIDCSENDITTHQFTWLPNSIYFQSYFRGYPLTDSNDIIESWLYTGSDTPPAGGENIRMNFWLLPPEDAPQGTPGGPPTDGKEAEIVIKNFRYLPMPGDLDNDNDVDWADFAILASYWLEGTNP